MKTLLTMLLVLAAAGPVWAQAVGDWHRVHGQVQSVQGHRLVLRADDGRVIHVDMSQVSDTVEAAMAPNAWVTVTGFPGGSRDRMTARYIEQDNGGYASPGGGAVDRVLPLVSSFMNSDEFRSRTAEARNDHRAAQHLVRQLYQGILDREPSEQERRDWVARLRETRDPQGAVAAFLDSAEYRAKNKNERQVLIDLYQGVYGRTPSAEEIASWERMIARR